jgi:hypothetical protein
MKYGKARRHFFLIIVPIISLIPVLLSCKSAEIMFAASIDDARQKQGGNSRDEEIQGKALLNAVGLIAIRIFGGINHHEENVPVDNLMLTDKKGDMKGYWKIMSGLEYIGKGYKTKAGGEKLVTHLNYLELPVYVAYAYPISSGTLFAGAGPYFAYGIGGKIKSSFVSINSFGENGAGGYKRFDAGLGLIAGYKMNNGFSVHIAYDLGLANIAFSSQDFTAKNRSISLNVGYEISRLFNPKNK